MSIKIITWNVNGVRAICKKGFADYFGQLAPDIFCIQETKAQPEQIPAELQAIKGYTFYCCSAQRRGYSGVAMWVRDGALKPLNVKCGFGIERFDIEGRTQIADYGSFLLYNIYFPNGGASEERLAYKMDFYAALLEHLQNLNPHKKDIIICGDVNTAHKEIDLARPGPNSTVSGFLPCERQWIDKLLAAGFYDAFRLFDSSAEKYTWWDYKTRARSRNVGWRIDYFFVSTAIKDKISNCSILADIPGSDHCPVSLTLETDI